MFKEMAAVMTDKEIERCMSIIVEGSKILEINRNIVQNYISVSFRIVGDVMQKKYEITLLPDGVDGLTEGIDYRVDAEYLYTQYMIAKGYSEYWKGNMFVGEEL